MKSTLKITTGFTVLTAGMAFILTCMYIGVLNFNIYGGLNTAIATLFLILGSAYWLLTNPNILSSTAFCTTSGIFIYLMQQNKMADNSSMFVFPMIICFLGLFLITNGLYSSNE